MFPKLNCISKLFGKPWGFKFQVINHDIFQICCKNCLQLMRDNKCPIYVALSLKKRHYWILNSCNLWTKFIEGNTVLSRHTLSLFKLQYTAADMSTKEKYRNMCIVTEDAHFCSLISFTWAFSVQDRWVCCANTLCQEAVRYWLQECMMVMGFDSSLRGPELSQTGACFHL